LKESAHRGSSLGLGNVLDTFLLACVTFLTWVVFKNDHLEVYS